ncbi:sugar diacid recognition domain-containing protein [Halalkalibacter okhensis]|uniref:Transcriptional regulator n=1 Tax=Halalkalibacter okhensis TaxID=333138 RepID=A0A0B0IGF0_9BACI|nr:sugar diacid recognition domain-containing protein [Halalkalibacter okhensis]KHF39154.1 hypothetical protein LQ50_17155 [Halalkalibacter okhensis]
MTMFLTEMLAQEIVDRTMAILPYNINVMDQEGKIIGSGDRKRILTKHEVASEVLRRKEAVEIGRADMDSWNGVKEGINLPIVFQGEVVGVVGITGDPNDTRGYGQLVKMTTEMIIEQAFLQKQLQLDERIKEEFVHQLISGNHLDDHLFYEKAKSLQVDLAVPRVVIVVKSNSHEMAQNRKLELYLSKLIEDDDLIATIYTGELVIIKKVYEKDRRWERERTLQTVQMWISQLHKMDSSIKMAVGRVAAVEKLHQSFTEAKETLGVGEKLVPEQKLLLFDDFSIYVFISKLANEIETNPLAELVQRLKHEDELGDLKKTLHVYIKENGKASNTANELFIHRNSLQYRLEKIKEITGKDPRNYKELFELYLSLMMDLFCYNEN